MDFKDKEIQEVIFRLSVIILLGLLVWNAFSPSYTYKTIYISDDAYYGFDNTLQSYGDKGCIVDSARRATSGSLYSSDTGYEIIFRCP